MNIYSTPFTAIDRTPYTYLLIHLPSKKFYYGCKYAAGCHPDTFWIDYFTSSNVVHTLIEQNEKSFAFIIDKTFSSKKECIAYEKFVLESVDAAGSDNWLNKTNGNYGSRTTKPLKFKKQRKKGENNPMALLTDEKVLEIRYRYSTEPLTFDDLGKEYGVHENSISDIIAHRTWTHLVDRAIPCGVKKPIKPSKLDLQLTDSVVKNIRLQYSTQRKTFIELGKQFNISRTIISDIVKRKIKNEISDLPYTPSNIKITYNARKYFSRELPKDEIYKMYLSDISLSHKDIGELYNVDGTTIQRLLKNMPKREMETIIPDDVILKIRHDSATLPDSFLDLSLKYNISQYRIIRIIHREIYSEIPEDLSLRKIVKPIKARNKRVPKIDLLSDKIKNEIREQFYKRKISKQKLAIMYCLSKSDIIKIFKEPKDIIGIIS